MDGYIKGQMMQTAVPLSPSGLSSWHPESWKKYIALQQPCYENVPLLKKSLRYLNSAPPIVSENEILLNLHYMSEAAKGNIFILQAGDCAETFADCNSHNVYSRMNHLRKMAEIFSEYLKKPVVIIGRIAGQYAKPRSEAYETLQSTSLLCYRGDIINGFDFTTEQRNPDPRRMVSAFLLSQKTARWIKNFNFGISDKVKNQQSESAFFYSHEALLLDYETALTRRSQKFNGYYNSGTHFLWLGERTKDITGSHVEYLRGIDNPIGIKVGPASNAEELVSLLYLLNPYKKEGRITLITRLGEKNTNKILPDLIKKVKTSASPVTWMCDPMHGNTEKIGEFKTRHFSSIFQEFEKTIDIHKELGENLAGIHLEVTYNPVTECLGGANAVTPECLPENYLTYCDPRLNAQQSFEIAHRMGEYLKHVIYK